MGFILIDCHFPPVAAARQPGAIHIQALRAFYQLFRHRHDGDGGGYGLWCVGGFGFFRDARHDVGASIIVWNDRTP